MKITKAVYDQTEFDAMQPNEQEMFVKKDEGYVLELPVEAVETLAVGLKANATKILGEKKDLQKQFDDYKKEVEAIGGSPAEIKAKLSAAKEATPEAIQQIRDQAQADLQALKDQHVTDNASKEEREAFLTGEIHRTVTRADVLSAITEHGGIPETLEPMILSRVRTVEKDVNGRKQFVTEVVDPKNPGQPRLKNSLGEPFSLSDQVAEIKADEKFAGCFLAGDGNGSGGKNPNNGRGASGAIQVSRAASKNSPRLYQEAKALADKEGKTIEFID